MTHEEDLRTVHACPRCSKIFHEDCHKDCLDQERVKIAIMRFRCNINKSKEFDELEKELGIND